MGYINITVLAILLSKGTSFVTHSRKINNNVYNRVNTMISCCSVDDSLVKKGPCPITLEHLEAAKLCKNVYDNGWLHGSEQFVDFKETNVQAALNVIENTLYVVYCGSSTRRDWQQNMKFNMANYPSNSKQEIHFGFLLNWISVKKEIETKIEIILDKYKNNVEKIVFCGHSAGGPLSILNTYDMADKLRDKYSIDVKAITLGAPRMGNEAFKYACEAKLETTRIVLDKDVVTRLPIGIFNWGDRYRHVGKPLQLRDGEILQRDTNAFESFKWILGGIPKFNLGLIDDHDISNYIEEMEKILEEDYCSHEKED